MPGATPLRPVIHFLVHRDGVRAFHLAYPALDPVSAEKRTVMTND